MITITISTDPQLQISVRQQLESAFAALGFFPGEATRSPLPQPAPTATVEAPKAIPGGTHDGVRALVTDIKNAYGPVGLEKAVKALRLIYPRMERVATLPDDPANLARCEETLRELQTSLSTSEADKIIS